MPTLFVSSPPNRTGVFAQERPLPAAVTAAGTGTAVIVGQFPWGPVNALTYPSTPGKAFQQFAPAGMDHTGSAYLSIIRKAWPRLGIIRAKDPAAVAATASILQSSTPVLTVTAICAGSQGNSIVITIAAADDGNANHFNFTATVTGASGSTVEKYPNCNISGVGADVLPNTTASVLLASVVKANVGVPSGGNTTMSGGTDGTTTSTHYVGTPGAGNFGFALCENDGTIDHLFTDDAGNSIRASVNNGLLAHIVLTANKIGYANGNSGQTAAQAQSDVANYRDTRMVYVDPWAYVLDDINGTQRLCPSSCWAASVAAQIPPSLDIGYRAQSQINMMAAIVQLEADRGSNAGVNTQAGISTLIYAPTGGVTFEAGVNTSAVSGQTDLTRSRMGIFIGKSVTAAWQPFVNAPNVQFFQQDLVNSLDAFLTTLKQQATINPAAAPYIVDYQLLDPKTVNTDASIANGDYTVAANIKTGSNMRRIFLGLQYGPNVQIVVL